MKTQQTPEYNHAEQCVYMQWTGCRISFLSSGISFMTDLLNI